MDEFTGRTMADRRWGEGLHQAVEAKEGLPIQNETVTLASITYQVRLKDRSGKRESRERSRAMWALNRSDKGHASDLVLPCAPAALMSIKFTPRVGT